MSFWSDVTASPSKVENPQAFPVGGKRQFVRFSRHQRYAPPSHGHDHSRHCGSHRCLNCRCKTRSRLVLTVLSSPPTMTILTSRSRFAKTITAGPFPTMLNGAPCVVILNTSRFTSVLMLYSLCEYDASGYGRWSAPLAPELGRHHQLPRPSVLH